MNKNRNSVEQQQQIDALGKRLTQMMIEQSQKIQTQEKELVEGEKKHKQMMEKQSKTLQETQQKLQAQETDMNKLLEEEQKLKMEVQNQKKQLLQEKQGKAMLETQAKKLEDQQKLHELTLEKLEASSNQQAKQMEAKLSTLSLALGLKHTFVMKDFSVERRKDKPDDWKSPPMYTHPGGYKFCIGVDANGWSAGRGKSVNVEVWRMPGEHDSQLKWPASAKFTIELINQQGGENVVCTTSTQDWEKVTRM